MRPARLPVVGCAALWRLVTLAIIDEFGCKVEEIGSFGFESEGWKGFTKVSAAWSEGLEDHFTSCKLTCNSIDQVMELSISIHSNVITASHFVKHRI